MAKSLSHDEIIARLPHGFELMEPYKGCVGDKHILKCPYCSKECSLRIDKVIYGFTRSCGCNHPGLRLGAMHVSLSYFSQIKAGAVKRDLVFDLRLQDVELLIVQQDFKCKLSGLPIQVGYDRKNVTASLDRIDPSKGYILSNVQWLHKDVNRIKSTYTEEYFIGLCKMIVDNKTRVLD